MNPLSMFGSILPNRNAPRRLPRKQAARVQRKKAPHRRFLWLEQLENRVTPSLLSTFELDANVATGVLGTSGSTTTSHDWDQIHTDATQPPGPGQRRLVCPTSGGPT